MCIRIMEAAEWQDRRSGYNHRWLKNSYIIGTLSRWEALIKGDITAQSCWKRDFENEIAEPWARRSGEVLDLAQRYEAEMSPGLLFGIAPLQYIDEETQLWMRPLTHVLWARKHQAQYRVTSVIGAYEAACGAYSELERAISASAEKADLCGEEFREQFSGFCNACALLGERVSEFNNAVEL